MNRILSLALAGALSFSLGSCMDHNEVPDNARALITAQQLPAANTDILQVKEKYSAPISGNNTFEEVKEDVIFEGVVVANDISGNLYQTLVLRDIKSTPGAPDDQCITVGVKTSTLFPHFALGQRVRINLNGLYIGNYSRTPKIGRPYYTSAGNLRLGPMLLEDVSTHIALVGTPNPKAPELTPRDLTTAAAASWLENKSNRNYLNCPLLATVSGKIKEVQGAEANTPAKGTLSGKLEPLPKIFAPKALYDAGFGVDRTLLLDNSTAGFTIRTSVRNNISFTRIPTASCVYTGVLSYYSDWQMQLRSLDDIQPTTAHTK